MIDKIKKNDDAYKTIGEIAKELNLINKKNGQLQTHTIRYWETQFKEIKPTLRAGGRRYYSDSDFKIITFIKYLLKDKGLTIAGVKKILSNNKTGSIDDEVNLGIYKPNLKSKSAIINKVKNISKILKEIKKIKNG
jgi:DNA-binding transcriptional MerR regulator